MNIDIISKTNLFLSVMASFVVISTALYQAYTKYIERTKNPLRFKSISIAHITKLKENNVISDKMSASLINNADKRIFRENYRINLTKIYRDLILSVEEQTNGILDADIFKMAETYIQYTNGVIKISNYSYFKYLNMFYNTMLAFIVIIILINGLLFFFTLYSFSTSDLKDINYIGISLIAINILIYIYLFIILLRSKRALHARSLITKCLSNNLETMSQFDTFSIKLTEEYMYIVASNNNRSYENLIAEEKKDKLSSENWIFIIIIIYLLFLFYTAGVVTILLSNL